MTENRSRFIATLAEQYRHLFASEEYAYAAQRHTPESLALVMVGSGPTFAGNKDGEGVKRTCRALGIRHTYRDINAYLSL